MSVHDAWNTQGGKLRIAAAWVGDMGPRHVLVRAQQLVRELEPVCLAMCGICAGDRSKVVLGDVIIADQLYFHDEGKIVISDDELHFAPKMSTFEMPMDWKMGAAFLGQEIGARFPISRPISKAVQRSWLLSALLAEEEQGATSPSTHPDRKAKCPGWADVVRSGEKSGHWSIQGGRLSLTTVGREQAQKERLIHIDGLPEDPPFQVHVGTIATGSTVQQDPTLFVKLRRMNRTTVGVEMEGASIAYIAAHFKRRSIVIKAVSDHADDEKDDSFRAFACRSSAYVLLAFLRKQLEPTVAPIVAVRTTVSIEGKNVRAEAATGETDSAHTKPESPEMPSEEAKRAELVIRVGQRVEAFSFACARLTQSHWRRICVHAPSALLERWINTMSEHPSDDGAAPSLMVSFWNSALELGLVPPLPAVDKRVDFEELAHYYREKKKFWGLSNRNELHLLGGRLLVRTAELGWDEGTWGAQHALAGPLFEWVWDVLTAANKDKIAIDKYGVLWWRGAGGVIKADISSVFFWPMAEMARFADHQLIARAWNRRHERAVRLHKTLPEDPSIIDDLALSFLDAHHNVWHDRREYGIEAGTNYVEDQDWKGCVSHLLGAARSEASSRANFGEWARTIPLFAAPESGLSDNTAATIIEAAKLDDVARQRLHALRLERARFCAPGKDPEQVLSAIDAEFSRHPWVKAFGRK